MTMGSSLFLRRSLVAFACLAFAACDGGSGEGRRAARLDVDGIFRACGGEARSAANPFGLNSDMSQSVEANLRFFERTESRAVAIEEATGSGVRILFHQPGGWFREDEGGQHGAVPTVPVMNGRKRNGTELYPWRWDLWADELRALTDAHPDWIIGVYFSGQVPTVEAQDAVDAEQGYETYDHFNFRHRALFEQVVDQWMSVGVREFVLDGAGAEAESAGMPDLAAAVRSRGGRLFVESHPRDDLGNLRTEFLQTIDGSLATHHVMVNNEPTSFGWFVPQGVIMMIALTGHEVARAPERSLPVQSDVDSYRSRGFVLLSGRDTFDHFVSR